MQLVGCCQVLFVIYRQLPKLTYHLIIEYNKVLMIFLILIVVGSACMLCRRFYQVDHDSTKHN